MHLVRPQVAGALAAQQAQGRRRAAWCGTAAAVLAGVLSAARPCLMHVRFGECLHAGNQGLSSSCGPKSLTIQANPAMIKHRDPAGSQQPLWPALLLRAAEWAATSAATLQVGAVQAARAKEQGQPDSVPPDTLLLDEVGHARQVVQVGMHMDNVVKLRYSRGFSYAHFRVAASLMLGLTVLLTALPQWHGFTRKFVCFLMILMRHSLFVPRR